MDKKLIIRIIQLSLVVFVLGCTQTTPPNVVILYTDDQGTMDVNCFGASDLFTPNLDQLAADGIRFTQAYAHTVCCPSRAALLTGRHPQRSGINNWTQNNAHAKEKGINMPLSEVTLAEVLQEAGYVTGLFGKWHLGGALENGPLEQGFDEFFGFRGGFIENYTHYFLHGMGFHDLWAGKEEIFQEGQYFPALMTEKAIDFIVRHKNEPFFLYAAFNLPHYPEQADAIFSPAYDELQEPRKSYAKVVSAVDGRIGLIIDTLKALDLFDHTIIYYMSDNGHSTEETSIRFDDHNSGLPKGFDYCAHGGGGYTGKWRGAKGSFFEGGIRVPAIISYPDKYPGGQVRDQIISGMDFFPTICELTNTPLPERQLDGHSLRSILESENAASSHEILYFGWTDRWAVREGKWKLIMDHDSLFLADLEAEQPEAHNHTDEYPEVVNRLLSYHKAWKEDVFSENPTNR